MELDYQKRIDIGESVETHSSAESSSDHPFDYSRRHVRSFVFAALFVAFCATTLLANDLPARQPISLSDAIHADQAPYYWKTVPVGRTAQLVTLFCRSCTEEQETADKNHSSSPAANASQTDLPLLSTLRDTLGDQNTHNDRLLYVWLLSYARPNAFQYVLSAMPFFYWRVGDGPNTKNIHSVAPLLNLTNREHTLVSGIGRQILQSSLLDPSATPIRVSSRAYRGNERDYQRFRLEEAATYLRKAPVSTDENGLSQAEINTVVARLELRKSLLGGLVPAKAVAHIGEEAGFTQERIRSRNWEVLRQCAERTGLIFEPLNLAGNSANYGVLWFPLGTAPPRSGTPTKSIWKLLNIHNPWKDRHLKNWHGPVYVREFDANGSLLPAGLTGVRQVTLVPLGVYSFDYPTAPLLLVDFRNSLHIRRREMTQRAINDVTAGIIGVSHFSNWYYYAAADLYDFVVSRHGGAMNQAARLDCYSRFRAALALDQGIDPKLHAQIESRIGSLTFNPLEPAPGKAIQLARAHYAALLAEIQNGELLTRIDKERRAELARFGESERARLARILLHDATFGTYTHRVKKDDENLMTLDREREVLYHLNFLDSLTGAGTPPEVSYAVDRIRASVASLNQLMPQIQAPSIRAHIARTLQQLQGISQNAELQADCSATLASLRDGSKQMPAVARNQRRMPSAGVAALISSKHAESFR